MTSHRITLTNTSQNTYVSSPSTTPLTLLLNAQRSGSYFDYGATFIDIEKVLLEADDSVSPIVTLDWPSTTNPNWGMALVSGSTSCSIAVVGTTTKFTFTLPSTGMSVFALTPGGAAGELEISVKKK